MKKFFQQFGDDGSVTYNAGLSSKEAAIKINPDGLVYFGHLKDHVYNGSGCLFAGQDIFMSSFVCGCPDGESLMIRDGDVRRLSFRDGAAVSNDPLVGCERDQYIEGYLEKDPLFDMFRQTKLRTECRRLEWSDVLAGERIIDAVHDIRELADGVDFIGLCGVDPVLLTKLPSSPPSGQVELAPGLSVKSIDVWRRKVHKLLSAESGNLRATSVKGFHMCDGSVYVVSTLPSNVEEYSLMPQNSSYDCLVDVMSEVCEILRWLTSIGIVWNGQINRKSFFTCSEGNVCLNTARLIARYSEPNKVFGGHFSDELRFMSSQQIVRASVPATCILDRMGFAIPPPESIALGESRNLGLLIFSVINDGSEIPFEWLSDAQFALASWIVCVDPCSPLTNLLSPLCMKPVDIKSPENATARDIDSLDSLASMGMKLFRGEWAIKDLARSLKAYIEWRDAQLAESSVETEVKAVFNRMSAFIHSSQTAVRSALTKSIDHSW